MIFDERVLVKNRLEERGENVSRIEKIEVSQRIQMLKESQSSKYHMDQAFIYQ